MSYLLMQETHLIPTFTDTHLLPTSIFAPPHQPSNDGGFRDITHFPRVYMGEVGKMRPTAPPHPHAPHLLTHFPQQPGS